MDWDMEKKSIFAKILELDGERIIMIHIQHVLTTILIATMIVVVMQLLMIVVSAAEGIPVLSLIHR